MTKTTWHSSDVFCKSPKKIRQKFEKKFQDIHSSKKKFSLIKQIGSVESSFGNRADTFLPNARFSSKSQEKNSPWILRQAIDLFMFLP